MGLLAQILRLKQPSLMHPHRMVYEVFTLTEHDRRFAEPAPMDVRFLGAFHIFILKSSFP
jgi:hypothetical protein